MTRSAPVVACRSCGAPVVWALTEAAKPMPLDKAEPTAADNLIAWQDEAGVLRVRYAHPSGLGLGPGERTATSHFATCPNANAHRRR